MTDNTPIYNLKAVMHEVGLSAATLRAWEQRYGLPKPQRTAGGHRLYSKQDIEMLKWLVAKQNEGLSISRAVEMWKTLKSGEANLTQSAHVPLVETSMGEGMLDELRERWIAACGVYDDSTANQILDQAFAIVAPETICTDVLQKGLAQIGLGWYYGSVSVQQEHFASAIATRRINSLLAAVPSPSRPGRILAACPPGETHDFILLLVTYLLRRGGWDVVYLGSNVPLQDLDVTIQATSPVLVLSAAQSINSAASLRGMSEYLAQHNIPLAYGGGIFISIPSATRYISGHYLGSNVAMVSQLVERLLSTPAIMPVAQPLTDNYRRTLNKFMLNKTAITSYVATQLPVNVMEPKFVELANENLSQILSSALTLGDINLLDPAINWLIGLLNNYGWLTTAVWQFYTIYLQAVETYMGDDGAIIQEWLEKQLLNHQIE